MQSSAIDLRPKDWSEIIGQEHIVQGIQKKLKDGVPPAWLFIGPSGSGKTTLAEILAREVQREGTDSELLDIRRINAADKNGVDDARALAEESKYYSTYGKYRVVIMDEAHMLTPAAQNTLLIPTEQKDSPTVWIFCTTDPQKLLPTLRSRCVTFELKRFTEHNITTLIVNATKAGKLSKDRADGYANKFIDKIIQSGLTSPREILYAWDKYISGVSLEDAVVLTPENDPVYTEIAKHASSGQWDRFRESVKTLKSIDVKGLKSVLAWGFKYRLLECELGSMQGDALSEALIRLGNLTSFEDGVTLASMAGIVYHYSRKVTKT